MSGYRLLRQMLKTMHAATSLLGILPADTGIQWDDVIFKGDAQGRYTGEMFETWYKMAAMLQSGLTSGLSSRTDRLPAISAGLRNHGFRPQRQRILDWETPLINAAQHSGTLTAGPPARSPCSRAHVHAGLAHRADDLVDEPGGTGAVHARRAALIASRVHRVALDAGTAPACTGSRSGRVGPP
jgi:hypothetical protein